MSVGRGYEQTLKGEDITTAYCICFMPSPLAAALQLRFHFDFLLFVRIDLDLRARLDLGILAMFKKAEWAE